MKCSIQTCNKEADEGIFCFRCDELLNEAAQEQRDELRRLEAQANGETLEEDYD